MSRSPHLLRRRGSTNSVSSRGSALSSAAGDDSHFSELETVNEPEAPFVRPDRNPGAAEFAKSALALVTLVPLRVSLLLMLLVTALPLGRLFLWLAGERGCTARLACPRATLVVRLSARAILLLLGFWRIEVEHPGATFSGAGGQGKKAPAAARILVANHLSVVEILYFLTLPEPPAFVLKASLARALVVGWVARLLGSVFVQKGEGGEGESRGEGGASQIAANLANSSRPLMIFPEGTTSNGSHLLRFRTGAFVPAEAVQPVLIRLPFQSFSPTYESIHTVIFAVRLLCQPQNRMQVRFLPPYTPSAAERTNARLYADNVCSLMARALRLPVSSAQYRDKLEYQAKLLKRLDEQEFPLLGTSRLTAMLLRPNPDERKPGTPPPLARRLATVRRDLAYSTSHERCRYDLYSPTTSSGQPVAGAGRTGRTPLLLFVHGGSWQRGDRLSWRYSVSAKDTNLLVALWHLCCTRQHENVGAAFSERGFTTAVVSYRLACLPLPLRLLEVLSSGLCNLLLLLVCAKLLLGTMLPPAAAALFAAARSAAESEPGETLDTWSFSSARLLTALLVAAALSRGARRCSALGFRTHAQRTAPFAVALLVPALRCAADSACRDPSASTAQNVAAFVVAVALTAAIAVEQLLGGAADAARSRGAHQHPAAAQDLQLFLRHASSEEGKAALGPGVDVGRSGIVVVGHSSGAHTAALVVLQSFLAAPAAATGPEADIGTHEEFAARAAQERKVKSSVKGVVCLSGPHTLHRLHRSWWQRLLILHPVFGEDAREHEEASPTQLAERLDTSQAAALPPFLLIATRGEILAPHSLDLHNALLSATPVELRDEERAACTLLTLPSLNHYSVMSRLQPTGSYLAEGCAVVRAVEEFVRAL